MEVRHTAAVLGIVSLLSTTALAGKLKPGEEAKFAIPRMSAPPTLDGVIDSEEWREAVAVGGIVNQANDVLIPRPTTFMFAWDPEHLYFACRAYVRPGYKPRIRDGRSEGAAYCFDDGLELIFKPTGQNVSAENHQTDFKMFLNCLGYVGDLTRIAVGQQMKNWAPKFKTATRITEPGTAPDGGSWWELEVSTSIQDFELTGPHQAGDNWKFMLVFNHMPGWMQARIPCVGDFFTASGKSIGTLVDDTVAVKMTQDSLSNLSSDGTAAITLTAYNPAGKEATVQVDIDVAGNVKKSETLTLPANGRAEVKLDEKLPEDVKNGAVTIRASQGDRTLLAYKAFFEVGKYTKMLAKVSPPDPSKFSFITEYNPVRNKLLIKADTYYLPDPEAARQLHYTVTPAEDDNPLIQGKVTDVAEWYFQDVVDLPLLEPGSYAVSAELILDDGTRLGPMRGKFEKKDEAKAFPEWWNTNYGDIEQVLPPFEAIRQITDGGWACWGREYTINALGLPEAVRSQDADVLAAPARIVAVVDGQEHVIPIGAPNIIDHKDWRVRFKGHAQGAGLEFTAEGWLEQDGLVYVDLTYAPAGNAPVTVDSLRIEYPLAETDADCLLCIGPGNNYASKTTMLLPKLEGERPREPQRLWSTLDTGITGSSMKVGSFYPTVWIGSERRGFLWWADHDRGWVQDSAVPAHEAVRRALPDDQADNSAVVLINNIVAKPIELTEPRTIAFSYMASPFKPLYKGWRSVTGGGPHTFFSPFRGVRTNPRTGKKYHDPSKGNINWIHPESELPEEWSELWAEQKKKADEHVRRSQPWNPYAARSGVNFTHMSFQLIGYGVKSMQSELYSYFGDEWFPNGHDTWNKSYTDYAMSLFDRVFREGGVRSTYWDLSFPIPYDSLMSGLCYRLPDGRIQPGYNGWNVRRFFMRLWALQDKYGLNPGSLAQHSTNAYIMVSLPWVDAVLDGEREWHLDTSDLDWVDYYPPERLRAMSMSQNWGTGIHWMGIIHSAEKEKVIEAKRAKAEYLWMHDTWHNPEIGAAMREYNDLRQFWSMPTSILDWGMNGEGVVYHPYWRNPFVSGQDNDILVSLWQLPEPGKDGASDRVLVGVFNLNRKDTKDATLNIDLEALNLLPEREWQDFIGVRNLYRREGAPAASLDFYGRKLKIEKLAPHEGRFIGIRRY